MENSKKRDILTDFSKHVPKLLQRQLITEQARKYIQNPGDPNSFYGACVLTPSIQRFHGSILFVDISGFTILSQKLDVESLKNYINGYFSNIIEIVEKWGGDVVKFAGDALYVVWQTITVRNGTAGAGDSSNDKGGVSSKPGKSMRSMSMMPTFINAQFRQNASEATRKAINCGLEICDVCGKYPVYMEGKSNPGKDAGQGMFSSIVSSITSKIISRGLTSDSQQPIAHLDVHCGVSVGLMAGLDVGYEDRWEYFIIGDPLGDVALAESFAEKGDVVISRAAHEMYHPNQQGVSAIYESEKLEPNFPSALDCSCTQIHSSCFRLACSVRPIVDTNSDKRPKSVSRSRSSSATIAINDNSKIYNEITRDMRGAVALITPAIKRAYMSKALKISKQLQDEENMAEEERTKELKGAEKLLPVFIHSRVRKHLTSWLESCLIDHLACHVHDVARGGYAMASDSSVETFDNMLCEFLMSAHRTKSVPVESVKSFPSISPKKPTAVVATVDDTDPNADELDDAVDSRFTFKDNSLRASSRQHLNDRIEAEVRNVTVMFIKIDSFDMSLLIDASQMKDNKKINPRYDEVYGFLDRTENEQMADKFIIEKLQRCLEVLYRAIYSHGGQMRQFIVDDKGTVCIASFGLRGAVNDDNAANAMEAADDIVRGLRAINLSSAIGITTGKVYCGLVGSRRRHEYAIMGPSVNLSARLMSKANYGTILCDQETMDRDRSHEYRCVGEIQAKGYAQPVSTYRPRFGDSVSIALSTTMQDNYDEDRSLAAIKASSGAHPVAKRFSALRFSIAMDSQQIRSMKSSKSVNLSTGERIQRLLSSVFYFTDEVSNKTVLTEPQQTLPAMIISDGLNSTQKLNGFRILRGRESELSDLLTFLLCGSAPKDSNFMFDHEAPSRMAVVAGIGGIGKTAFLSAFGQKLYSASKQDLSCNIMILSNRTSSLSNSSRLNPLRPILMEILRWSKKIIDTSVVANGRSATGGGVHHVRRAKSTKSLLVKHDSMEEYARSLELIFKQLPSEMAAYKQIVMDIAGIKPQSRSNIGDQSPSAVTSPSDSSQRNKVNDKNIPEIKAVLLAIMNYFAAYTKRAILVMIEDAHAIDSSTIEVLEHLWLNGVGLHFLISSLVVPMGQEQTSSSSVKVRNFRRSPTNNALNNINNSSASSMFQSSNKSSRGGIFSQFLGHPNFLQIDLSSLSREASIELAGDIAVNASPETISKLIASGGGNPLYLVQLATSLASEGGQVEFTGQSHLQSVKDMNNISMMQRRVEEIICYRLDRLDPLSQMVLKASTVAAASGEVFSAKLIAFMINAKSNVFVNAVHNSPLVTARTELNPVNSKLNGMNNGSAPGKSPKQASHPSLIISASQNLNSMQYRLLVVSHVLKLLAQTGIFIQSAKDFTEAMEEGDFSHLAGEVEDDYEFMIPIEQSIIYSLIVDEQREYFHGKVAQFHYIEWQKQTSSTGESELLSLNNRVTEVAYHAEQASLWVLAMRAYAFASGIQRLLSNPKKAMETLMECYKIFKCYEQESGDIITPLSLRRMEGEPFLLSCVIRHEDYSSMELPRDLENELECVYSVFGTDEANINLAIKLHLYMADLYFLSFADVEMAQHLLGVALKLIVTARLCAAEAATTGDSAWKISLDSLRTGSIDADDEILIDVHQSIVSRSLDHTEICHFFTTFTGLLQASPSLISVPRYSSKVISALEPLFMAHPIGYIPFQSLKILDATRAKDTTQIKLLLSLQETQEKENNGINSESEMNKLIITFGKNVGMQANCVSLQTLVFTGDTSSLIDSIYSHIERHLLFHVGTLTIYSSLLPAVSATMLIGRWDILHRWLKLMDKASEISHDILSPHKVLWKHLKTWIQSAYYFQQTCKGGIVLPMEKVGLQDMKESIDYFLSSDDTNNMLSSPKTSTSMYLNYLLIKCPSTISALLLRSGLNPIALAWQLICFAMYLHQKDIVVEPRIRQDYDILFHAALSRIISYLTNPEFAVVQLDCSLVSMGLTLHMLSPLRCAVGINAAVGHLMKDYVCNASANKAASNNAAANNSSIGSGQSRNQTLPEQNSLLQEALEERFHTFSNASFIRDISSNEGPLSSSSQLVLPQYRLLHRFILDFFPSCQLTKTTALTTTVETMALSTSSIATVSTFSVSDGLDASAATTTAMDSSISENAILSPSKSKSIDVDKDGVSIDGEVMSFATPMSK